MLAEEARLPGPACRRTRRRSNDFADHNLLFGEGETGLMVYAILLRWEWSPEDDVRPLLPDVGLERLPIRTPRPTPGRSESAANRDRIERTGSRPRRVRMCHRSNGTDVR